MDYPSSFLGRGLAFPPRVDKATGRFVMSTGEDDIKQSIYIILMTRKNERAMMPDFGCNIHNYIFELPDAANLSMLRTEIMDALATWESRVVDVNVSFDLGKLNVGQLIINIDYTVRSTNSPDNLVFPYYLYEGVGG